MLVQVHGDDAASATGPEQKVVRWLQSWFGDESVSGVAVVNCPIPCHRAGTGQGHRAGIVVFTPQTCLIIEVLGLAERVNGTLVCSGNGPWTVPSQSARIAGAEGASPVIRVSEYMFDLERLIRVPEQRWAVTGLVLLIPRAGTRVTLRKNALPIGVDVVLGDRRATLREHFVRLAERGDAQWNADLVHRALSRFDLPEPPTRDELIAEGFPATRYRPAAPAPVPAAAPAGSPGAARPGNATLAQPVSSESRVGQALLGTKSIVVFALVLLMIVLAGLLGLCGRTADPVPPEPLESATQISVTPSEPSPAPTCYPFQTVC